MSAPVVGTDSPRSHGPDPEHRRVLVREALASALYLAVVLLATLVAVPQERLPSDEVLVRLIVGAGVGLLAAHWFAFRLAARLTTDTGAWSASAAQEAAAQLAGGLGVAVLAAAPFLLLDGESALLTSLLVLAALPAVAGLGIARLQERSWLFALVYGGVVLGVAGAVVMLKVALSH